MLYFKHMSTKTEPVISDQPDPWIGSAVYEKYREASVAGFQPVPDLLLKNQEKLGLSATDLAVLLNVLMHWWVPHRKPFPRSTTISKRMGLSPRTVQRSLQQMEKLGILERQKIEGGPTYLNPEPLVAKLEDLAKDDPDYEIRSRRRKDKYGEGDPGPQQISQENGLEIPF